MSFPVRVGPDPRAPEVLPVRGFRQGGSEGFTLVELLVSVVAGLVLLAGVFQVLLGNQRLTTARDMEIRGRQTQLAGTDLLFGELREISPSGGDIIAMDSTSIHFRAQRKFGLVCQINYTVGNVEVIPVGIKFESGDSLFVFADGDEETGTDDVWIPGVVTGTDTTTTCLGTSSHELNIPGSQAAMVADSVRIGAPIRSFQRFTYSLGQDGGRWFLMRQMDGASAVPMVGPLLPMADGGLHFDYFDALGNVTSTPADVASVAVTLRTGADVRSAQGDMVADSVTTLISLRN
jgi:hypothetical protein